jgi:uncharacterized membrane protein
MINEHELLQKLELRISHLLRAGVVLSGTFLFIGWIWLLIKNGTQLTSFSTYSPEPFLNSFSTALKTNNYALITSQLGLGSIVLLPLMRVIFTGYLFLKQRDFTLALMATVVFLALISSFFLGIEL